MENSEEVETATPEETSAVKETSPPEETSAVEETSHAEPPETREITEEPEPAPKAKAKGRPKGSVKKKPVIVEPESQRTSYTEPEPPAPLDIFEVIRQRQMAQLQRKDAFYRTFLPT